jgi:hypothetical protein
MFDSNHVQNDFIYQTGGSIHLSAGKLFSAVARAFLPPTYQNRSVLLLGLTCPVTQHATTGTWKRRHLETSSYTIINQEGPSWKTSKDRNFSSLFITTKVLLMKHQQTGLSSVITSPFYTYYHDTSIVFPLPSFLTHSAVMQCV